MAGEPAAVPSAGRAGSGYVGRFAPSPTGPLHAGSLVAALASWLDARAHGGRWLVRIEDVDGPRCSLAAEAEILRQLDALGLRPDAPPVRQSARDTAYEAALAQLRDAGLAYPCGCTRRDIELALQAAGRTHARHAEWVYPGTCRDGLHGKPARAWRLRCDASGPHCDATAGPRKKAAPSHSEAVPDDAAQMHGTGSCVIHWHDRRLGPQWQDVAHTVGDFVLKRADGLWAYQLAVVVDDAWQAVTDVVRGEDLADNTARQILLQRSLGVPTPSYLHVPLVCDANGEKLSKQHGAPAVDTAQALAALQAAGERLGLRVDGAGASAADWLHAAVQAWRGSCCRTD